MTRSLRQTFAVIALLLFSGIAWADPLDNARDAGHIIELQSGYVEATASAPANVRKLATSVNERRRMAYERIAKKNKLSVDQVARESYRLRFQAQNP